jgi:hypothetical protein
VAIYKRRYKENCYTACAATGCGTEVRRSIPGRGTDFWFSTSSPPSLLSKGYRTIIRPKKKKAGACKWTLRFYKVPRLRKSTSLYQKSMAHTLCVYVMSIFVPISSDGFPDLWILTQAVQCFILRWCTGVPLAKLQTHGIAAVGGENWWRKLRNFPVFAKSACAVQTTLLVWSAVKMYLLKPISY